MADKLKFAYDEKSDVITIEGIKYAGDFFRGLGGGVQHGQLFRVVSRDAGVLTLECPPSNHRLPASAPAPLAPPAATVAAPTTPKA